MLAIVGLRKSDSIPIDIADHPAVARQLARRHSAVTRRNQAIAGQSPERRTRAPNYLGAVEVNTLAGSHREVCRGPRSGSVPEYAQARCYVAFGSDFGALILNEIRSFVRKVIRPLSSRAMSCSTTWATRM